MYHACNTCCYSFYDSHKGEPKCTNPKTKADNVIYDCLKYDGVVDQCPYWEDHEDEPDRYNVAEQ